MSRHISIPDMIRLLLYECDMEGGIRPWATNRGLHPSVIDKFVSGKRGPSPQLLAALKLRKRVLYERADDESYTD